jgi:hypothetical protein
MKTVSKIWRSLFAGAKPKMKDGLVRMFEVEYANEARHLRKMYGCITYDMVKAALSDKRK